MRGVANGVLARRSWSLGQNGSLLAFSAIGVGRHRLLPGYRSGLNQTNSTDAFGCGHEIAWTSRYLPVAIMGAVVLAVPPQALAQQPRRLRALRRHGTLCHYAKRIRHPALFNPGGRAAGRRPRRGVSPGRRLARTSTDRWASNSRCAGRRSTARRRSERNGASRRCAPRRCNLNARFLPHNGWPAVAGTRDAVSSRENSMMDAMQSMMGGTDGSACW